VTVVAELRRLFAPRHVAVFGGSAAGEVVRQCQALGFGGALWPVHPRHGQVAGLRCYRDVASLPEPPDASFIAVSAEQSIAVVAQLAARGAGGVICHASGFAEVGAAGAALQQRLVTAAGAMALVGPNCYGMLNYLDGVALWPDQHGGQRVARGVAIVAQSGNIALNLSMQRRHLPLAYLITVGNQAGAGIEAIVGALLQDPRVSAIGLHVEALQDVAGFSRVAQQALQRRVPLVILKAGSSALGAATTVSHTGSLAGPDALYDALFARLGVARVRDPAQLLETLKLLHVTGPLAGRRIVSASCSGGEAALVADLAQPRGLQLPPPPEPAWQALHAALGDRVAIANPLDYHTYVWGDRAAQTACFTALLQCRFDLHLLVLDFPRADRCSSAAWQITLDAFVAAYQRESQPCAVVASLPEGMPDAMARQLLDGGIAPMQGLPDCLDAVAHAAAIGAAQQRWRVIQPVAGSVGVMAPGLVPDAAFRIAADRASSLGSTAASAVVAGVGAPSPLPGVPVCMLDEVASKQALAAFGLPTPRGEVLVAPAAVAETIVRLGFPLVAKAVSATLAHKSDAGAVWLNLRDATAVGHALAALAPLSGRVLVEQMATGVVAEFLIGVTRDPQFGQVLTLGAGGVQVELLRDTVTLLLPVSRADIRSAFEALRCWPLVCGFRGRPAGDVESLIDATEAVLAYAQAHAAQLLELDVNPILVLPQGRGVLAVDAMIRLTQQE